MNNYLVITTINEPTEAVKKFASRKDLSVVVVGDQKTPIEWKCEGVEYLSLEKQNRSNISNLIPYNHYSRKNVGYEYAIKSNAKLIIDTDDDNIPKANWKILDFDKSHLQSHNNLGFVNIYKEFTSRKIWPRGLPLKYIDSILLGKYKEKYYNNIGVWQTLADGDPDVDAIYRLIIGVDPIKFDEHDSISLGQGTISPFNSQSTFFSQNLFPLLYLPSYVSFRFTDILRGYIAQPIMWKFGYTLGIYKPIVFQKRNIHDFNIDFQQEIEMYQHSEKIVSVVEDAIRDCSSITDSIIEAYNAMVSKGICQEKELEIVREWTMLFK